MVSRSRVPLIFLIVILAALLALGIYTASRDDPRPHGGGVSTVELDGLGFSIAGAAIAPLEPGITVPVDLQFTNRSDQSIRVVEVTIKLTRVTAPRSDLAHPCNVADFALQQPADDLELVLDASTDITLAKLGIPVASWPRVMLANTDQNQDGCKAASVELTFRAFGSAED